MKGNKFAMKSFIGKFEVILKGILEKLPYFFLHWGRGVEICLYYYSPHVLCFKDKRAIGLFNFFQGDHRYYILSLLKSMVH